MIPYSLLDLCPIVRGSDAAHALRNSLDLARHAERWGYRRYWLAEHHNMLGIASAATAVVVGHIAAGTTSIRVGSGGIMLPNHSPLVIAEQFGTLESLFPGRIDLGLGRAPGADQRTARALRRQNASSADEFPHDVAELRAYFEPSAEGEAVRAIPGAGLRVPIWLLGSSLFSAQLAAYLGLPFAFASHFAPDDMEAAVRIYRREFRASASLAKPRVMLALNLFAADSAAEARRSFTSLQQGFLNLRRGRPGQLSPPVDTMDGLWDEFERAGVERALRCSVVGDADQVRRGIEEFVDALRPEELIMTAQIFDHSARLRSFEIAAEILRSPRRTVPVTNSSAT